MPLFFAIAGVGFFAGLWGRSELDGTTDNPVSAAANSSVKIAFAVLALWMVYKGMAKGKA